MIGNNSNQTIEEQIYIFNEEEEQKLKVEKPWQNDPKYFEEVKISAIALIKMVSHAVSGGKEEIMGVMQGKTIGKTFYVLDAFGLPVKGTETRVNAGMEAQIFQVNQLEMMQEIGKKEYICGWYHSHPGYGCWLSGIDVTTQFFNQKMGQQSIAIVIDPIKTISTGKIEIGCFRTYPEGFNPKNEEETLENIPLEKYKDYGLHAGRYYKLNHGFFKTFSDQQILNELWNKYWMNTIASQSITTTKDFLKLSLLNIKTKLERISLINNDTSKINELKSIKASSINIINEQSSYLSLEVLKSIVFAELNRSKNIVKLF